MRRRTKVLIIIAALLAVALAGAVVTMRMWASNTLARIQVVDIAPAPDEPASQSVDTPGSRPAGTAEPRDGELGTVPATFLLLGSDSRAGDNRGYGRVSGQRSDTALLVHLFGDGRQVLAVSIPRDMRAPMPSCAGGGYNRFNAAMSLGGIPCAVTAAERLTGVHVDHVAVIDFAGFKDITTAIGGVEVCLDEAVDDPYSGLSLAAGTHLLSGERALAYVRARHGMADGSDIARTRRQQAFLASALRKILSEQTLTNPLALKSLAEAVASSLTVDRPLRSESALLGYARAMAGVPASAVTFVTMPWKSSYGGMIAPGDGASQLFTAMRTDTGIDPGDGAGPLRWKPQDVVIRILDASGQPGSGSRAAARLREVGFAVTGVVRADREQASAIMVPSSAGQQARTVAASTGLPVTKGPGQGRIVTVVVGRDFGAVTKPRVMDALAHKRSSWSSTPASTAAQRYCGT